MEDNAIDEGQVLDTPQPDSSEGSPEPTGKAINISGKEFYVNDDVAQAYSELTKGIDRRFDERSQELGALRQFRTDVMQREEAEKQAHPNNQNGSPDYSTLMYEDPDKFVSMIDDKIAKSKEDLQNDYRHAEQTKVQERDFWNSIWAENQDLALIKDQATDIVKLIGQKYAHLQNSKETRDLLAAETRQWVKGIVGSNGGNESDGFVEGSSVSASKTIKKKKDEKPRKTTKDILEARRDVKKKAMAGI